MAIFIKTDEGAGVKAILIGTDTVEGVAGIGIGIAFGVIFSTSATVIALQGLVKGSVFCVLGSFATFSFEDMLEKGCLVRGDSMP
jgi:hypothetical protein